MERINPDKIGIISKKTALEHLRREEGENNLDVDEMQELEKAHEEHMESMDKIREVLENKGIEYRTLHPESDDLDEFDLYVVAGGDGTLLQSHPEIGKTPVITLNTDEKRSDGGLLKFTADQFKEVINRLLDNNFEIEHWSRVEAEIDGEKVKALNEIYVGADHSGNVAEYIIQLGDQEEYQRNSGMIVSTGVGSTGWASNVRKDLKGEKIDFPNQSPRLYFASWHNIEDAAIQNRVIEEDEKLRITSKMNHDGVIKADGDRRVHEFPRGKKAEITQSEELKVIT